jgi:molybdenum cofactor guanylyltransferase
MDKINKENIAGVVLAGGRSSRMGFRDKALLELRQKPLIEHVIANASGQVDQLILSVNKNQQDYDYLELPLVEDLQRRYLGPLVGIHRAMTYFREQSSEHKYLACFPADTPIFPTNIVARLSQALQENKSTFVCSRYRGQIEPLFSLWSLQSEHEVEDCLKAEKYGPKLLLPILDSYVLDIEADDNGLFLNINTESALQKVENLCARKNIL